MSTAPITNEIRQNKKMLVKSMVFVCGLRAICCCHRLCRRRRRYRLSLSFAPSLGHGLTHYSVNITVHTKSVFMVRLANYDFCVNFLLFLFSFERRKTIWSDPFASHASAQIDCEYRFRIELMRWRRLLSSIWFIQLSASQRSWTKRVSRRCAFSCVVVVAHFCFFLFVIRIHSPIQRHISQI